MMEKIKAKGVLYEKTIKGRCEKRKVSKCTNICRTYTKIQSVFVDLLEKDDDVFQFTKRFDTSVRYGMIVYTSETRATN